jgi:HK97 family phage major capsid protein
MGSKVSALPVLSALAQAYFVNGDTGLKQTTSMAWSGVVLTAEEIAAVVPVPEAALDDAELDLWAEIQEGLTEAVGITLDAAVFSGTGKPASWAQAIVPAATAANNTNVADSTAAQGGIRQRHRRDLR